MINDQSLYFVFNGKKSSDFNVWCSGDGLYRLPDRDVEYIAVPGRNGDLAVDNGRWKNVSVTYSCFIPKNFRECYAYLVSWLASQKGYGRLEDARHPEFYWLARMDADVDPKMVVADDSGTFTLTFNCKPQRFLKSGEIPVEIPCSPAVSPASARRYWRLSSFEEDEQTFITTKLQSIGYTTTEINAMQFSIMDFDSDVVNAITEDYVEHGVDIRKNSEFKGADTDRFFAFFTNIVDAETIGWTMYTDPKTALQNSDFLWCNQVITKKAFGQECWWGDVMYAQDECYQFGTVVNPTRFNAMPKFRIQLPSNMNGLAGATVYMVGVGQDGIALKWTSDMEVYTNCILTLDTELMDAYILPDDNVRGQHLGGKFVSFNSAVKFYGNRIVLKPGENTIRLDPMIAGCEIVPRWWTI